MSLCCLKDKITPPARRNRMLATRFGVVMTAVLLLLLLPFFVQLYPLQTSQLHSHQRGTQAHLSIWIADLHDGVRADLTSMLSCWGHTVILAGQKGLATPYPVAFASPLVQGLRRPMSPVIASHDRQNSYMSEKDIQEMFSYYQHDDQMASANLFICGFPAAYCEAWLPFNKTILWWPAHRYSLSRCTTEQWQRLTDHVRLSAAAGHIVAAASIYDMEYVRYFTGLDPLYLPANSFWYTMGVNYTMKAQEILVGPLQRQEFSGLQAMNAAAGGKYVFVPVKTKYSRFKLQDIANHRAVVIIPYAAMSYGITELYAIGVPMFVPDVDFLVTLGTANDMRLRDPVYCGAHLKPPEAHPSQPHPYSPESLDPAATRYWLGFADFYTKPHIMTFSSWEDLVKKLDAADYVGIHAKMMVENQRLKGILEVSWQQVLNSVDRHRTVPLSYHDAVTKLWNSTRLQVD